MNHIFENKSRIWIPDKDWKNILIEILEFNHIYLDFYSSKMIKIPVSDYIVFTGTIEKTAEEIQPNIVFFTSELPYEIAQNIIPNLAPGGVLIYPENLKNIDILLKNTEVYFRKTPYNIPIYYKENSEIIIDTILGKLSLPEIFHNKINDFFGLQMLCQQLGIMEDEFIETLACFS